MKPTTALVTGAASGMGRTFALRMAAAGVRVAALDRSADALQALSSESGNITPYPCDVTDLDAINGVVAEVELALGTIDRLVHCAAIMPAGPLAEQEATTLTQVMTVNYGGTVNTVNTVLPGMLSRRDGEIVLFGSVGGAVPIPECGGYCASKAAVNSYSEILIEENRGSGVHIMLVCPSLVNTPLLQQAADTGDPSMVRYSIEQQRYADPEKIIDAVEQGLRSKTDILFPTMEARIMGWLRRFSPRLVWKILHASNRAQARSQVEQ